MHRSGIRGRLRLRSTLARRAFSGVRAIEGSPARAALARGRCRGLDSLHVYEANFSCLGIDDEFDVVTMRGVLEYSTVYYPAGASLSAENAALANLRTGAHALRSPAVIVVAIENRLARVREGALESLPELEDELVTTAVAFLEGATALKEADRTWT
jgi:hypothetical protein